MSRTDTTGRNLVPSNGTYRWVSEINLLLDLRIPFTVWKIMLFSTFVPIFALAVIQAIDGMLLESLGAILRLYLLLAAVVTGLTILGYYAVYIPVMGARCAILFEMKEDEVDHILPAKNQSRQELLSLLGIAAGAAVGNPTVVGANVLSAVRRTMRTRYKDIRSITVWEKSGIIRLRASDLTRNIIYAPPGQVNFVLDYIHARCKPDVAVYTRR